MTNKDRLSYAGVVQKYNGKQIMFSLNEPLDTNRIQAMYRKLNVPYEAEIIFRDPRIMSISQRKFIFALLGDIKNKTYQPLPDIKDYFYLEYGERTGYEISLSDKSEATVSEANVLIEIILEFMFEFDVPFKVGFEILPMSISYYVYLCIVNRECVCCRAKHADIHHAKGLVGSGRNRKKFNHINSYFLPLCRVHHQEAEGNLELFTSTHHFEPIKLSAETIVNLGLNTKEQMHKFINEGLIPDKQLIGHLGE